MSAFDWHLYVRDPSGFRVAEVDDYISCTLSPTYNDVGTWSLLMDRRAPQAELLQLPRYGLVAIRNGVTVLSGPMTHRQHSVDVERQELQLDGVTDDVWLKRRLVSPSPGDSGPPYSSAADVRTGVASTILRQYVNVNLGPGATTARRLGGLALGVDPATGSTVSGNGRWDNLLVFLQTLANSGGVGFRVIQVGNGLEFQVYAPVDRTASVAFSVGLGNLTAFSYESTAPEGNYVFVGADGTGTARVIKEYGDSTSISEWGRIEGEFVSASDTTVPTQIQQSGTDALTQGGEQASLAITPTETPTLLYGQHYSLGDKVTVQLEGPAANPYSTTGQVQDILRKVDINLTVDGPQTVTPTVGTAARTDLSRLFVAFRQVRTRLNHLENG